MRLITKKMLLSSLISQYKKQYPTNKHFAFGSCSDDKLKLLEAESSLTEERVAEIIGNNSWLKNICDECKKDASTIVVFGKEDYWEDESVRICIDCLKKGLELAES